jgi:adenylate kinase family enzyme
MRLGVPHVELDAIYHQPGWTPKPTTELRYEVAELVAGDGWVIDGNYSAVRDLVWRRADMVIWLDLARVTVMRQVISRTLRRLWRREELWNGNREGWRNFLLGADDSIIAAAWTQHAKYHDRYAAAAADPAYSHLTFVRLGSRAEIDRFLQS